MGEREWEKVGEMIGERERGIDKVTLSGRDKKRKRKRQEERENLKKQSKGKGEFE